MQSPLSPLYRLCGALAAFFLVAIAVLIFASITTRLMGVAVRGLNAYAGYCMAASSFLALAYAFSRNGHIRVSLLLQRFHGRARRMAELWCLGIGTLLAGYFAWYSARMVWVSHKINDISQATDATPLWIPQTAMAFGTFVFAVSLAERFVLVARGAPPEGVAEGDAGDALQQE